MRSLTDAELELVYVLHFEGHVHDTLEGEPAIAGFSALDALLNWLVDHPNNLAHNPTQPYITGQLLPDVCGCCNTNYGMTVGGRLRLRCPSCPPKGFAARLFNFQRYARTTAIDDPRFWQLLLQYKGRDYV